MSQSSPEVADVLAPASVARSAWSPVVVLVVVLSVFAAYTAIAFELSWETARGNIGPGFFPRIIGMLGVVCTIVALVRQLRIARRAEGDGAEGGDESREGVELMVGPTVFVVATTVALVALFVPLGAVLSVALFLLANLHYFNRGRLGFNVALALVFPCAVYVLLAVALGAPLPTGPLPAF